MQLCCRDEIAAAIGSRSFAFSLLVHSDSTSPLVDFSRNSSILQVRSDATPKMLVDFLVSESGSEAAQVSKQCVMTVSMTLGIGCYCCYQLLALPVLCLELMAKPARLVRAVYIA